MAGGQSVCKVLPAEVNYLGRLPSNLCLEGFYKMSFLLSQLFDV